MFKTVPVFVILLQVAFASGLEGNNSNTSCEKWTKLMKMDCDYLRTRSLGGQRIELSKVADARPKGYKVNLRFSVVAEGEVWIRLYSHDQLPIRYVIALLDRAIYFVSGLDSQVISKDLALPVISSSVPSDVVIAVTEDNVLTVTVDDKTLFTYDGIMPVAFEYFEFASDYGAEAEYHYNCKLRNTESTSKDVGALSLLSLLRKEKKLCELEQKTVEQDAEIMKRTSALNNQPTTTAKQDAKIAELESALDEQQKKMGERDAEIARLKSKHITYDDIIEFAGCIIGKLRAFEC